MQLHPVLCVQDAAQIYDIADKKDRYNNDGAALLVFKGGFGTGVPGARPWFEKKLGLYL